MSIEIASDKPEIKNQENMHYENCHVHDHTGLTTCNDGHCHIHPGVTSTPITSNNSHYHQIIGATTYEDGHFHTYRANTGLAVNLPQGFHTHYTSFTTSFVDGHVHNVMGFVMATMYEEYYKPPMPYK